VHGSWEAIVIGGAYSGKGMASFANTLSAEDAKDIHAYVVDQIANSIALCQGEYRKNYPELLESACSRPQPAAAR
jgi:quinohemoprotein ethanol dehydrogenase